MQDEQEELLWQDVDQAERHLLLGDFEEAQVAASRVLQKAFALSNLKANAGSGSGGLVECSSMVLLQAQHHLGRHKQLEDQLLGSFSSLDAIPKEVFLTWSCLRTKAGDKEGAALAVSKYLQLNGRHLDRHACCSLAGLYVLDILCDACEDPQRAQDWLGQQSDWLDASTSKVLLKKVRRRQQRLLSSSNSREAQSKRDAFFVPKATSAPKGVAVESSSVLPSRSNTLPNTSDNASTSAVQFNSLGAQANPSSGPDFESNHMVNSSLTPSSPALREGWVSWLLFWTKLVQRWWQKKWQHWNQANGKGGSAFLLLAAGVFTYALIKERATFRRHLRKLAQVCHQNLADLYGLAFSYSLNPLAAAAQLTPPSVQRS